MNLLKFSWMKSFRCCVVIFPAFFAFHFSCSAQENASIEFGKVKPKDFVISSAAVDSNTNAVIVYDRGDLSFEGNKTGWFSYVFKRSTRIKLLDKKSFDLATVELQLYKAEDGEQKSEKISGVSYSMENGKVIETRLNEKDIFQQKYDKTHYFKKFAIPGVKEGCIIEYSYTIKSDFIFNLPTWKFQSVDGPTVWSEYNVAIPNLLSYMSVFQGLHKFDVDKSGTGSASYMVVQQDHDGAYGTKRENRLNVSSTLTKHTWAMKNIPAFNVESYISSPANFVDKISFQLFKTYDGESSHDVANDWKNVAEKLMNREDFGKPLDEEHYWLDEILSRVVDADDDRLQKAKKIYYYVQKNYVCDDHNDKYITTSLHDLVKKKSGTVGDINLLLIAMLKHAKINAKPVLLSTTEFGRNSPTYPFLDRLNYVVGVININAVNYYLDATIPFLPFGKLPLNCYNGHARIISSDTTSINFSADLIKETQTTSVFILNVEEGGVEGVLTQKMSTYKSLDTKTDIAKSSLQSFEKKLKASYPEDFLISNIKVDSVLMAESNASLKFDFKLTAFGEADIVYFNPLVGEVLKKNPFYAAERIYPVEMPSAIDELYTFNMEIPSGYTVEELPKSMRALLNETDGSFEYLIQANSTSIQMKCRLVLNRSNFEPEDYQTLRDFYTTVVKKQSEQIVLKKIK